MILDIDGVLLRGSQVIPGSVKAVNRLIGAGIKVCYLTNNSTRSCQGLLGSLTSNGFPDGLALTSGRAVALYIKEHFGSKRCLVLGEAALVEELTSHGFDVRTAGQPMKRDGPEWVPDCVVVGLDREVTYVKITEALWAIRDGAKFIATNADPNLPYEDGRVLPGAGTIIESLRISSGVDPVVVGKPNPYPILLAVKEMGLSPGEVLVIGDRPDIDIAAGLGAGCKVALVLTGDVKENKDRNIPTFTDLGHAVDSTLSGRRF